MSHLPERQVIGPYVQPDERVRLMEAYVEEAMDDPIVQAIALEVARANPGNIPQAIVDSQHKLVNYALDCGDGTCEIISTARATLREGMGDCKKKSILVAAMLRYLGYPARVVWLHQQDYGASNNHVVAQICEPTVPAAGRPTAVQVYVPDGTEQACGSGWKWVETTLPGAIVGRDPYEELARLGTQHGRTGL